MSFIDAVRYRLRVLFRRALYGRELEDEIEHQLGSDAPSTDRRSHHFAELDRQEHPRRTSPFGVNTNRTSLNEERRIVSGLAVVDTGQQDVRFALRFLRRRRTQTAVMLATLALGIGAATSIFSVANVVLFRPLPFDDAGQLITIWRTRPDVRLIPGRSAAWDRFTFSIPTIHRWAAAQHSFSSLAERTMNTTLVAGEEGAEELSVVHASASLLPMLRSSRARPRFHQ